MIHFKNKEIDLLKYLFGAKMSFKNGPMLLHRKVTCSDPEQQLKCTFVTPMGERKTLTVCEGHSVLDIAHEHNIDLEGACEGSIACSTCHVIVDPEYYSKMEEQSEKELDMLDLAFGLTETSRLGCQIIMNKDLDGITLMLPTATR
ncbi:hypothetical protein PORY_001166 [Pneumocystis oryctolagi]|uniref:Uncharacterized protein n=1 Tax=Pneumocystis oryctolagi TaxID=42067 RepID=A0ACB7CE15_9ASCO|nr:hypothetical protein PORY_001166 [Pneumocystis oryctolagi]